MGGARRYAVSRSLGALGVLLVLAGTADAFIFADDFANGIDPFYWEIFCNQPLYVIDDSNGEVRISKPVGGDHTLQYAALYFRGTVHGDFDASVVFRDAYIDRILGSPANQIQFNALFGNSALCVVRSDEVGLGDNHHVWLSPPGVCQGVAPDTTTAGSMRIRRAGVHFEAYIHGELFWEADLNADPVDYLGFVLQNNGTIDSTSVVFDDFALTAEAVTAAGDGGAPAKVAVFPPFPNPFNPWTTVSFALPGTGPILAAIYDTQGTEIKRLIDETLGEGMHSVVWDGRNSRGAPMPSGIYVFRLRTSWGVQARKLSLIR